LTLPSNPKDRELDQKTIEEALQLMADFLRERRRELTVIVVGGATSVLFLKTRKTTHDIDFFGANVCSADLKLLDAAIHHAEKRSGRWLGDNWFNNMTATILESDVHQTLTERALKQNEIVFHRKGLRLLAAPWHYAVCGKMARMAKAKRRNYDVDDAAGYLDRHIKTHGNRPVTVEQIEGWVISYRRKTTISVVMEVAVKYYGVYRKHGIVEFTRYCQCAAPGGSHHDMCDKCRRKIL
jgi:hypothetical protein